MLTYMRSAKPATRAVSVVPRLSAVVRRVISLVSLSAPCNPDQYINWLKCAFKLTYLLNVVVPPCPVSTRVFETT
jgi:hypothetical protein